MTAVDLTGVSVDFPLFSAVSRSLKRNLLARTTRNRFHRAPDRTVIARALSDISLALRSGDRLGLTGGNGAGKSTLLRTIAGIYEPTRGTVRIDGRVTTLFSLNVGVESEATGYENIELRGLAAGMSRAEIAAKSDEIAAFTELGDHLYLPLNTYSAGMRARLLFAIATATRPEILLMDEWIGVGDKHFIAKSQARINEVVQRAGILVLASHNRQLLQRTCNRVIRLEGGTIVADGAPDQVLDVA